jgi:hypothetical protein
MSDTSIKRLSYYKRRLRAIDEADGNAVDEDRLEREAFESYLIQFELGYVRYNTLIDACNAKRGWENDRTLDPTWVQELSLSLITTIHNDAYNAIPALVDPSWYGDLVEPTKSFIPGEIKHLRHFVRPLQDGERFHVCGGNHRFVASGLANAYLKFEIHKLKLVFEKLGGSLKAIRAAGMDGEDEEEDEEEEEEEEEIDLPSDEEEYDDTTPARGSKTGKGGKANKAKRAPAKKGQVKRSTKTQKSAGTKGGRSKGKEDTVVDPKKLLTDQDREAIKLAGDEVDKVHARAKKRVRDLLQTIKEQKLNATEKRERVQEELEISMKKSANMGTVVYRLYDKRE